VALSLFHSPRDDARVPPGSIFTERLELVPITVELVHAVLANDRAACESLVDARFPDDWPGRVFVERAFTIDLEAVLAKPEVRLWGDRVLVTRHGPRSVVGSVIFHGKPLETGRASLAYGVERASQGRGYATESVRACVAWALEQGEVKAVEATTTPWHRASIRVLLKAGMRQIDTVDHLMLGELVVYAIDRGTQLPPLAIPSNLPI
jgi:RimJ/RimL family protein N-acetyltransferase